MTIILKSGLVWSLEMEHGWGVSGSLFIDLFYLCLRSEVCAWGLCVPILFFSVLLQIRAPQGTFEMKFMVSDTGTLNTFRNEKHKHTHVKHRAEENIFLSVLFTALREGVGFSQKFST